LDLKSRNHFVLIPRDSRHTNELMVCIFFFNWKE